MPSQYVDGIGQLNDGSWRLDATMFLPDFSPEAVYKKLHPTTPSPIFWSPERIAYSHSILSIEVTSSYQGADDPTGELSQKQGLKNSEQFDIPSENYPIDGFKEYDDERGNPDIYISSEAEPYFITCYANACFIGEILDHSFWVEISLDRSVIPKSLYILTRLNQIIKSTKCA